MVEIGFTGGMQSVRAMIEANSGPVFTTEQIAAALSVSTDRVLHSAEADRLIRYPNVEGEGWLFPAWQIADGQVLPWVQPLITAYGGNGLYLIDFMTVARTNGANYLARMNTPEGAADVLAAAARSNPD